MGSVEIAQKVHSTAKQDDACWALELWLSGKSWECSLCYEKLGSNWGTRLQLGKIAYNERSFNEELHAVHVLLERKS